VVLEIASESAKKEFWINEMTILLHPRKEELQQFSSAWSEEIIIYSEICEESKNLQYSIVNKYLIQ